MKKAASTTKRTTSKKPKTEGLGVIGELDRYLFGEGRHYQLYHKLGAHPYTYRGQDGYYFAVWAPHAAAVSLVGDFNAWNPDATPMKPVADSGIYELFVPGLGVGQLYKFAITTHTGTILFKADPYAFSAEYRPGTASVTADIRGFKWNDSKWMESRAGTGSGQGANLYLRGSLRILEKEKPPGKRTVITLTWKPRMSWLTMSWKWATPM